MKTQHFSMPRIMVRGMVWISIMVLSLANIQTAAAEPQNSGETNVPTAVMQNIDMNVMYKGYDNKYAISVPGVSNDKVKVAAKGATVCKLEDGLWAIIPSGNEESSVTVTISAEINGQVKVAGTQVFAVKPLPKPETYLVVNGGMYASGEKISLPALLNENAKLEVGYGKNSALNIPFEVISFRASINGIMMDAKGNMFTAAQKERIQKLKMGSTIILSDIRVKGPNGSTIALPPVVLILN